MWIKSTAILQHSGRFVRLEGDPLQYCKLPQQCFIANCSKKAQLLMLGQPKKPMLNSWLQLESSVKSYFDC